MSQNLENMEVQEGTVLTSSTTFYYLHQFIDSGSFGRVATAFDLVANKDVALKVLKAKNCSTSRWEIEMLRTLQVLDPAKTNVVQCFEVFEHQGFTCLAFEMLERSLHQFMEDREREPLTISEIRPITHQLLTAYDALKGIGVIHADLKLDNIMLVNHQNQPFKVKLIDFGLSLRTSEAEDGMVIQVEPCRAPEVFLGLPLSEAVDMWSLGCVLFTLFTSCHLFGYSCRYEVLSNIVEIIGQPSDHLLSAGLFTKRYFVEDRYSHSPTWWLKTPPEYYQDPASWPLFPPRVVNSLHDLVVVEPEMEGCIQIADRRAYVGLLAGLLTIDSQARMDPRRALSHPFISMVHLEGHKTSAYVLDAVEKMGCIMTEELGLMTEGTVAVSDGAAAEGAPAGEGPGPGSYDPPESSPEAAADQGAPVGEEPHVGSYDPTASVPESAADEGTPAGEGPRPGSCDPPVSFPEAAVPEELGPDSDGRPEGSLKNSPEAAADSTYQGAHTEEEERPDYDGLPQDQAPKPERRSRWKRAKKVLSRAMRRVFCMRRNPE